MRSLLAVGRFGLHAAIGPDSPERVDSYEAGLKADFFDGKLHRAPKWTYNLGVDYLRELYGRDLLHGGGRISNTLDAGVFYFGAVSPRRQLGVEASVKF